MKNIPKLITKILAGLWLITLCTYSSWILGTLAHELMHKQTALETHAITINYDGTGQTEARAFDEGVSHEWIYFNGDVVFIALLTVSLLSLILVIS